MAVRGNVAKEEITRKILEIFSNSFINGKEIRIPYQENGEEVQIKVTLTAAKENVDNPSFATNSAVAPNSVTVSFSQPSFAEVSSVPTDEEKENLQKLITKLGL